MPITPPPMMITLLKSTGSFPKMSSEVIAVSIPAIGGAKTEEPVAMRRFLNSSSFPFTLTEDFEVILPSPL